MRAQVNFNFSFFLIKSINGSINTRKIKRVEEKRKMRKQITRWSEAEEASRSFTDNSSRTTTDASRIMSIIAAYFN